MVTQLLPLPHLRAGFLLAVDPEQLGAAAEEWLMCWFVLDHASLRTAELPQRQGPGELALAEGLGSWG